METTLAKLLESPARGSGARPLAVRDVNAALLEERLADGCAVTGATLLPDGLGPILGPCVAFVLATPGRGTRGAEVLPVAIGPRLRRLAAGPLGGTRVATAEEARAAAAVLPSDATPEGLLAQLAGIFHATTSLPAEERSARLMDWIMERIDASRCALVPYDSGACGPPLAFHLRGSAHAPADPRHLPRKVLDHVVRTRQPVASDDAQGGAGPIPSAGTIARQRIRSFMAVPVLFHGDLLGIAFVDRFDRPGPFTPEQRATFEALAYALAQPLLDLREQQRRRDFEALREEMLARTDVEPRVTSPALQAVLERVGALARHADEHLLLLGETGVGKEWVARHAHDMSGRNGAFVAVNAAAIPAELFASELMGSVRGAFTGATDRPGRVAEADGGTLFLDEIGDLELINQVKLLRFLQDRRVTPVGSTGERFVDVRVVAATNRPILTLVRAGAFRADLLYRFAPPILIPPLRERREEILPLAEAFLRVKARQRGMRPPRLTAGAADLLESHSWPGNVRQLEMVLAHALSLSRGTPIRREHLEPLLAADADGAGASADAPASWQELQASLESIEAEWLRQGLESCAGGVEILARRVGCPHTTLRRALQRHGLLPGRKA